MRMKKIGPGASQILLCRSATDCTLGCTCSVSIALPPFKKKNRQTNRHETTLHLSYNHMYLFLRHGYSFTFLKKRCPYHTTRFYRHCPITCRLILSYTVENNDSGSKRLPLALVTIETYLDCEHRDFSQCCQLFFSKGQALW